MLMLLHAGRYFYLSDISVCGLIERGILCRYNWTLQCYTTIDVVLGHCIGKFVDCHNRYIIKTWIIYTVDISLIEYISALDTVGCSLSVVFHAQFWNPVVSFCCFVFNVSYHCIHW